MLMIHTGMLGIVVRNRENDVKSVASVLNETEYCRSPLLRDNVPHSLLSAHSDC